MIEEAVEHGHQLEGFRAALDAGQVKSALRAMGIADKPIRLTYRQFLACALSQRLTIAAEPDEHSGGKISMGNREMAPVRHSGLQIVLALDRTQRLTHVAINRIHAVAQFSRLLHYHLAYGQIAMLATAKQLGDGLGGMNRPKFRNRHRQRRKPMLEDGRHPEPDAHDHSIDA